MSDEARHLSSEERDEQGRPMTYWGGKEQPSSDSMSTQRVHERIVDANTLPLHLELLKVSSIDSDNVVVRGDIVAALCECAQILQEIDASEDGVSIDLDVRIAVAIDKLEALCPSK